MYVSKIMYVQVMHSRSLLWLPTRIGPSSFCFGHKSTCRDIPFAERLPRGYTELDWKTSVHTTSIVYAMGQTQSRTDSTSSRAVDPSACPVPHNPSAAAAPEGSCPVTHDAPPKLAQCPIDHGKNNPLNQIPELAQARAPNQTTDLPLSRTESSIPKDTSAKWEYPSPQQFYNALVRKGWETPEEHVETMVDIHNFLNEQAWMEVLKWEKLQYQ
jgi:hypothetical protein